MKTQKRSPGPRSGKTPAAEGAVVVRVRVVETGLMPGVRLAGEKLQLAAVGNPLQEKPTVEERSPTGLTVMLNVAVCPALMVALCGEAPIVKSAGTDNAIFSTSAAEVA